ncbi:class I SAM-dependent methyltransferase [Rhizobium changzhiense]|uniref:class I SAM-dependent methyltransferase n=1 Tax=Rhizobium changzhiense TaxID=2692317 RepID=UPI001F0BA10E|nr:class I SAM-dependent methyltransferase [Rhizobium changzhiense]MCH4544437.1 class I SAM-dependent methyltransferase [Rhizobium changzhiense]
MGMLIYDALVLSRIAQETAERKSCLTLGVPTLNFKDEHFLHHWSTHPELKDANIGKQPFDTSAGFFHNLGFENISALDISDYEGADIIADLNEPDLPQRIGRQFDVVYDSGTLEHIFDAPSAMRSIAQLVKIGGVVVHATPSNGFLDHGFWQVSPDLYRTFYKKAGFEILTSSLFVFAENPYAMPAEQNLYRTHGRKYITRMAPEALLVFAARKTHDGNLGPISLQEYYSHMHADASAETTARFFLKFGEIPEPDQEPAGTPKRHGAISTLFSRFGVRKR